MYYDAQGREIEDPEMDAYYADRYERQKHVNRLKRTVWKDMKNAQEKHEVKKERKLRRTRSW